MPNAQQTTEDCILNLLTDNSWVMTLQTKIDISIIGMEPITMYNIKLTWTN